MHIRPISLVTLRGFATNSKVIDFSSKELWTKSLEGNVLLGNLNKLKEENRVLIKSSEDSATLNDYNLSEALPITAFPSKEIERDVSSDNKISNWRKPLVKWYRMGKFMFKVYKNGVKNTYSTYSEGKKFPYDVKELVKLIEFKEIESRVLNESKLDGLGITRKAYLQWLRKDEFWKLPQFLMVFLFFEEFTFLFYYLFPNLSPWSCLTPGSYNKIAEQRVKRLLENPQEKYLSPYQISGPAVVDFLRARRIISGWRTRIFELTKEYKIPVESLVELSQKINVDDWLLLRVLLKETDEPIFISDRELADAIFQRQLYSSGEDINKLVKDKEGQQVLLWRLFIYLSYKYDKTISAGDLKGSLLAEKWGVNDMTKFNFPGSTQLLTLERLYLVDTKHY